MLQAMAMASIEREWRRIMVVTDRRTDGCRIRDYFETGAYYAIGDHNTSIWRYMDGAWTNLTDPANTNGLQTVAIDPFDPSHIIVQTPAGNLE